MCRAQNHVLSVNLSFTGMFAYFVLMFAVIRRCVAHKTEVLRPKVKVIVTPVTNSKTLGDELSPKRLKSSFATIKLPLKAPLHQETIRFI